MKTPLEVFTTFFNSFLVTDLMFSFFGQKVALSLRVLDLNSILKLQSLT
jgi:hypothetical protein